MPNTKNIMSFLSIHWIARIEAHPIWLAATLYGMALPVNNNRFASCGIVEIQQGKTTDQNVPP